MASQKTESEAVNQHLTFREITKKLVFPRAVGASMKTINAIVTPSPLFLSSLIFIPYFCFSL